MPAGKVAYEISSEKVKHLSERRAQNETLALMPSFLQGHTSITLLTRIIRLAYVLMRAFTLTPRQPKRIIEFRDALSRKAITVFYF